MDLTFSPEQQELAEAVRRFAKEQVTPERLNKWESVAGGIDGDLWRAISELGWIGLGLPVIAGGSGLGLVDVACLLSECARGLIPTAVSHAIRGAWALAQLDPQAGELAALAQGRQRLALAIEEQSASDPAAFGTRLEGGGASTRLHGAKWYVPHADQADLFLVAARDGGGLALVLAERRAANVRALRSFVGGETQAVVTFEGAPIVRRLGAAERGIEALARLRRQQSALALAEMVGGMDAVIEMTVEYTKVREQFGQKIAVFQAVQHQVADMATAHTASRHLAWRVITRIAEAAEQPLDLPVACAYAGAAFKMVANSGHHLHGGAGFVVEHPLHYHTERAQSLCIRYAPEAPALERVAAALLD